MQNLLQKKEQLKQEAKSFCNNTSNPLEKRWEVVLEFGDTISVPDFKFPNIEWVNFYYNRWEVYSVFNVLQDALQYDPELNETQFKEYCCQNFISNVQYSNFLSIKK